VRENKPGQGPNQREECLQLRKKPQCWPRYSGNSRAQSGVRLIAESTNPLLRKCSLKRLTIRRNSERALTSAISKDWSGGLPFTVLYNEQGGIIFHRQGKLDHSNIEGEIEKTLDDNE
jgi:hypothetical protein